MTTKDQIKKAIRKVIIEQDGDRFLNLSEKDQENIVTAVLIGHVEREQKNTI